MSLVGPRPHPLELNDQYRKRLDTYMQRHRVKPGITGWAQINGCRGATEALEVEEQGRWQGLVDDRDQYLLMGYIGFGVAGAAAIGTRMAIADRISSGEDVKSPKPPVPVSLSPNEDKVRLVPTSPQMTERTRAPQNGAEEGRRCRANMRLPMFRRSSLAAGGRLPRPRRRFEPLSSRDALVSVLA